MKVSSLDVNGGIELMMKMRQWQGLVSVESETVNSIGCRENDMGEDFEEPIMEGQLMLDAFRCVEDVDPPQAPLVPRLGKKECYEKMFSATKSKQKRNEDSSSTWSSAIVFISKHSDKIIHDEAVHLLEVGKRLGLSLAISDEAVIKQFFELEKRDQKARREAYGGQDYGWSFISSVDRSRGLFNLWNSSFQYVSSFSGPDFAGVCLDWKNRHRVFIVNVYSPCSLSGKEAI
ncbi:hypothetical protein RIF29_16252 [Crotalaria pallida]|uniref:Uncharacterized protein n=1 Tax=Crotalaria pallida TaxID=3830 RepID=A0AAN9FEX3_CROPI